MDKYNYTVMFKSGKEISISDAEFKVLTTKGHNRGALSELSKTTFVDVAEIVAVYRNDK